PHFSRCTQTKVHAFITRGKIAACGAYECVLLQPLFRNHMDSSPESIAVADGADKIDEQPVIRGSALIAKNNCGPVVAIDRDIDRPIVIQVSERCAPCRQRYPERWTAFSRYVAELPRIVFHEKEWFEVTKGRISQFDIVHDVSLGEKDVEPAVVVVVDHFRSPAGVLHRDPADATGVAHIVKAPFAVSE